MRNVIVAIVMLFMCSISVVSAQGLFGDIDWDLTAAVDLPMSDLGDFASTGFGVGSDVFFWSPDSQSNIQVGGRVAFNYFTEDLGTATMFEVVPTVRYNMPSSGSVRFFGQAGLGLFFVGTKYEWDSPSYTIGGVTYGGDSGEETDSETKFGITVGAGAIVPFAGQEVVLMPLFNLVEDANYLGLNVGILMP